MERVIGLVRSGRGDFGRHVERLRELYFQKTNMRLFPETLNVELRAEWTVPDDAMRLEAHEYGGSVSTSIVPCRVFGREAFVLRTDANENGTGDHSRRIVEIASDVNLRETYELEDGDGVELELPA